MAWLEWLGKGVLSGAIVVTASEIAKKSSIFGALIVSLPIVSILSLTWLYSDTKDTAKVADFAEGILWLVIPSLALFVSFPVFIKRGIEFYPSLLISSGQRQPIIVYCRAGCDQSTLISTLTDLNL